MRVRVKLFGLLGRRFPDYDLEKGLEVEVPEGARIGELLARLEISNNDDAVVTVNGLVQKTDGTLKHRDLVYIFQSVVGG